MKHEKDFESVKLNLILTLQFVASCILAVASAGIVQQAYVAAPGKNSINLTFKILNSFKPRNLNFNCWKSPLIPYEFTCEP